MNDRPDPRLLLPPRLRRFPADLTAVVAIVVLTLGAALLPVVSETPLRVVVGLPFVLFVPGYAFVAALFPEAGSGPVDDDRGDGDDGITDPTDERGIDGIERVALSFGTSIAIVPLIGLVLNFTPWGIRLVPILLAVGGFTLGMAYLGAVRRQALPADERFSVPYREWVAAGRGELFDPDSRADLALNVLLVVSVLLAASSVAYAVAVPKQGESFSEFYILTENETGDLVADDYPTEFVAGESKSLVVGIGNQEHEEVRYSVVTELQRVEIRNNSTTVLEERELDRTRVTLVDNETWTERQAITPRMTGERLRLAFLLYQGDPPNDPTTTNAYRELHLWVNVTTSGNESASVPETPVVSDATSSAASPTRATTDDVPSPRPSFGPLARPTGAVEGRQIAA